MRKQTILLSLSVSKLHSIFRSTFYKQFAINISVKYSVNTCITLHPLIILPIVKKSNLNVNNVKIKTAHKASVLQKPVSEIKKKCFWKEDLESLILVQRFTLIFGMSRAQPISIATLSNFTPYKGNAKILRAQSTGKSITGWIFGLKRGDKKCCFCCLCCLQTVWKKSEAKVTY